MSMKHDVLIELLDVFSNSRIQIDRILFEYEIPKIVVPFIAYSRFKMIYRYWYINIITH